MLAIASFLSVLIFLILVSMDDSNPVELLGHISVYFFISLCSFFLILCLILIVRAVIRYRQMSRL
ncbi:hypothetical protein SAMN06269117_1431 [Balnearium lithotrophicum]|uniref:Uncharacterized protein n=1 Tax=Balnearium lithotrophicum TaxID=223788 RepID=A0A521EJ73_9BACT|nr:hypothetical protein SAMN06269117_1431 [Balnearium lithotrophicum]